MKKELIDNWLRQSEEVLDASGSASQQSAEHIHQFAVSMLSAFYGENSVQLRTYISSSGAYNPKNGWGERVTHIARTAKGAIQSVVRQINAGLVVNIRAQAKGEVFGDLITLAHDVLGDKSDSAKNTAAVLVAAAFEDVLRSLGVDKANVEGRPKLDHVVNELKSVGVLQGGNLTTCLGYLKFRNDSLHADWDQVYRHQVESCLLFVQSLIQEHMS